MAYVSPCLSAPEELVPFGPCMGKCLIKEPLFYFYLISDSGEQSYVKQRTVRVYTLGNIKSLKLCWSLTSRHSSGYPLVDYLYNDFYFFF